MADRFRGILDAARQGNCLAQTQLMEMYEAEILALAQARLGRLLRPHLDPFDLVQAVHCRLLWGLREGKFVIDNPRKLVGLTRTMVRREIAHHWRKLKRQQRAEEDGGNLLHGLLSRIDEPSRTVGRADYLRWLLEDVEDEDRKLIELRIQGYSTVEAAEKLGVADNLARARLSRLRKRWRENKAEPIELS